jgi:hypothetical protein
VAITLSAASVSSGPFNIPTPRTSVPIQTPKVDGLSPKGGSAIYEAAPPAYHQGKLPGVMKPPTLHLRTRSSHKF